MMVLEAKEQKARAMSLLSAAGTQGLLRSELESHGIELPALNHLYSKSKAVRPLCARLKTAALANT